MGKIHNIKLVTYVLLAISFMCIGSTFNNLNAQNALCDRNPLYWPLGIGFASLGGSIILGIIFKHMMPHDLYTEMDNIKL